MKSVDPTDFFLLEPHLSLVTTQVRETIIDPHVAIRHLIFPESGLVSITTAGNRTIEIGLIGLEGLVGAAPLLLGSDRSPFRHFIQCPGDGYQIEAEPFMAAVAQSEPLRMLLLRFVHTLIVQLAQTAFVNAIFDIEARLARWLLMCQDRVGDEIALTHEFLSVMLGVQRTSVTLALQVLEGHGLIRARRGRIEIRDRQRLLEMADESYGVAEAEYARLIPQA